MAELQIEALRKSFGAQPVLRGVDLTVRSGALVAILGASGSGKTTLLRLLCGFERADGGTIRIGSLPVAAPGLHLPPEDRAIGYVAQEGALFPHLSVADNIVFGLPRRQRRAHARVAELLELVGLPAGYASRPPHQLSGGEQQRVALARALAPDPALVLLDEPFSALDAGLRAETRRAVAAALAAKGATALLVTHDQGEALSMGREVAVLRGGTVVQVAPPQELYRRPADVELARFVGEAVILPGRAGSGWVDCSVGRLRLAGPVEDGAVDVVIRPEQIRLEPGAGQARILGITFYGHDCSVRLGLAGEDVPAVEALVPGHAPFQVGDAVALRVEGEVMAYPRKA
jgi:iron(III) transport system ATP-binding protein